MDNDVFARQIMEHEGVRLKMYKDSLGVETIGVGRNIRDKGITNAEAQYLLGNDIREVEQELDREVPWWRSLDEVRQRVLADMCFNLGVTKLKTFTWTLVAMRNGDYVGASAGMLASLWAHQVGKRRSGRLAKMMKTGLDVSLAEV